VKSREENDRQALLSGMCSRINNNAIMDEVGLPKFAPILIIVPPSVAENWAVSTNITVCTFFYLVSIVLINHSSAFYHNSLILQHGGTST